MFKISSHLWSLSITLYVLNYGIRTNYPAYWDRQEASKSGCLITSVRMEESFVYLKSSDTREKVSRIFCRCERQALEMILLEYLKEG